MKHGTDYSGHFFGYLTVIKTIYRGRNRQRFADVICACGNLKQVQLHAMTSANTTSCGCIRYVKNTKHGGCDTPEYRVWASMHQRCKNPRSQVWDRYGARGITVSKEWGSFTKFMSDMGPRPGKGYSLDRIDNNGNYCKENCRWATFSQQVKNTSKSRLYNLNGKLLNVREVADILSLNANTLRMRISRHKESIDVAVEHCLNYQRRVDK